MSFLIRNTNCIVCGKPAFWNDALWNFHDCGQCFCHRGCITTLFLQACDNRSLFPPRCDCGIEVDLAAVLLYFSQPFLIVLSYINRILVTSQIRLSLPLHIITTYRRWIRAGRDVAAIRCAHCKHQFTKQAITVTLEGGQKFLSCTKCGDTTCLWCEKLELNKSHSTCRLRCLCGEHRWQSDPASRWLKCDCERERCSVCSKGIRQCECTVDEESSSNKEDSSGEHRPSGGNKIDSSPPWYYDADISRRIKEWRSSIGRRYPIEDCTSDDRETRDATLDLWPSQEAAIKQTYEDDGVHARCENLDDVVLGYY